MKKILTLFLIILSIVTVIQTPVKAAEPIKSNATCYCLPGVTASGEGVRDGICAGKKEWFGKTLAVYKRLPDDSLGDFIDYFECLDKGGTKAIDNGYVIDIWKKDLESCQEFMDLVYEDGCQGRIYVFVID